MIRVGYVKIQKTSKQVEIFRILKIFRDSLTLLFFNEFTYLSDFKLLRLYVLSLFLIKL